MLKTGKEHLESIRDGRVIYIGEEKVTDVTTHPAYRNAAQSIASLYDLKCAPENRASIVASLDSTAALLPVTSAITVFDSTMSSATATWRPAS